jgi:hypothetical protein
MAGRTSHNHLSNAILGKERNLFNDSLVVDALTA